MKSSKQLGNDTDIQKLCSEIVTHEYESRGYKNVFFDFKIAKEDAQENFSVILNSEDPFLNGEFFVLVNNIVNEIEKAGFTYMGTNYFYDFCFLKFEIKK